MKKRTGVTVLSLLSLAFLLATVIMYVVFCFVPSVRQSAPVVDFVDLNKGLWNLFTKYTSESLKYNLFAWGIVVLFVGLTIPWLIVELKRKRKSVWAFVVLWLFVCYVAELAHVYYSFGLVSVKCLSAVYAYSMLACLIVSKVLAIVLFIVDLATGKIKPYVAEDNYEEVTFTQTPVEEPATESPVEEESVEEVPDDVVEEEARVIEEKEAEPVKTPIKKAPKKVKKEVKKAAPSKKDEKKIYHISERKELNKWQVKAENSDKAVKLFNTQREAKTYAMSLVDNDIGYIRVHTREGKIRKTSKRVYPSEDK